MTIAETKVYTFLIMTDIRDYNLDYFEPTCEIMPGQRRDISPLRSDVMTLEVVSGLGCVIIDETCEKIVSSGDRIAQISGVICQAECIGSDSLIMRRTYE